LGIECAPIDERTWLFPILKPEGDWTAFDCNYTELMRADYADGYSPREGICVDLGPCAEGRSVIAVRRGFRNRWEPLLGDSGRPVRLGSALAYIELLT
jgi:hypothetical protein